MERAKAGGSTRLLLVKDDESIAEPLITGLEREGFNVIWATDGQAALAADETDFVLLDLGLPDLDGAEVARRIQASPGDEIGRCGNSGHSLEPHLHIQIQNSPIPINHHQDTRNRGDIKHPIQDSLLRRNDRVNVHN